MTDLNLLAAELYPHWVADNERYLSHLLGEDWEYFQEIGIKERLVDIDGQILPDFTDHAIFSDWDCGNWGELLYTLYVVAYSFADYVATSRHIN